MTSASVAIVGSGVSGLVCAHALRSTRHVAVTLFDMSTRGPGGRSASRMQEGYQFDHGCSFIAPPQNPKVAELVGELAQAGALRAWDQTIQKFDMASKSMRDVNTGEEGFCGCFRRQGSGGVLVGVPSMGAVAQHLANSSDAQTRWGTRVTQARWSPEARKWSLSGMIGVHKDSGGVSEVEALGNFDSLVIADAAAMRPGSAGQVALHASSPGGALSFIHGRANTAHVLPEGRSAVHCVFSSSGHGLLRVTDSVTSGRGADPRKPRHVAIVDQLVRDSVMPASIKVLVAILPMVAVTGLVCCLQDVQDRIAATKHNPTFAVMLTFPKTMGLPFAACQIENHPAISFLSCDSSKPGRARQDGKECWVALASTDFAREMLAKKPISVDGKYNPQTQEYLQSLLPTMMKEVMSLLPALGVEHVPQPCFSAMQRWGAGFVANPVGVPVLGSSDENFFACGDFCLGSTFENAALSGMHAAAHVQDTIAVSPAPSRL